ncbi:MAG: nucleotidyl transferase AbiEii/AbiGii toxin family protein [Planctomycetota bacterium]
MRRSKLNESENDRLTRIKRRVVIALFSDDELLDRLVLKGGNALDLAHHATTRASVDLDFSMESAFPKDELGSIRDRIERRLHQAFLPEGLKVFDIVLKEAIENVTDDLKDFWGGYVLEFRLIDAKMSDELGANLEDIRRQAIPVGLRNNTRFRVDISKYEYCDGKQISDFDGYTIYVYTLEMIVCEKLRAICQQTDEYRLLVKKQHAAARARDFLDIYSTIQQFSIDLTAPKNLDLLENVFKAKRVPLHLLDVFQTQRDFHRQDWPAVKDAVRPGVPLQLFDFYFDYVVDLCQQLKPARDE